MHAIGLIETVGYTTAVSAADVALKAADVRLLAIERIIGVSGALGVTIQFSGDVAAVTSAVDAGKKEAERVGKLVSAHVIPRAHSEVNDKLISRFNLLDKQSKELSGLPGAASEKTKAGGKKKQTSREKRKKASTGQKDEKNKSVKTEETTAVHSDDSSPNETEAINEQVNNN